MPEPIVIPTGLPDDLKDSFNSGLRIEALLIHQNRLLSEMLAKLKPAEEVKAATS